MRSIPRLLLPLFLLCLGPVLPSAAFTGDDWLPLDPADLALKAPVVEKDADAKQSFGKFVLATTSKAAHRARCCVTTYESRFLLSEVESRKARSTYRSSVTGKSRTLRRALSSRTAVSLSSRKPTFWSAPSRSQTA